MKIFSHSKKNVSDSDELIQLLDSYAGVGLWDAVLFNGDPMHEKSRWTWSSEFRRLCGFENKEDFPDVVGSWADRLHPYDVDPTFDLFTKALSGETQGYDAIYRLKVADGSYRWFRATGGVARNQEGVPSRACGSLVDIHEAKLDQETREERVKHLDQLIQAFDTDITGSLASSSQAATQMQDAAQQQTNMATQSHEKLSQISHISQEASEDVTKISDITTQLSNSISDISLKASEATNVAITISNEAKRTNEVVNSLAGTSQKIGEIIDLINSIAGQTNLLALNATIEAARAGEMGKGFAIVAQEVKALAGQTAAATEEISNQILSIQNQTNDAVEAIDCVNEISHKITELSSGIETAVEEQNSATMDISDKVSVLVKNMERTAGTIDEVASVSESGLAISEQTQSQSYEIVQKANEITTQVGTFLEKIKVA